MTEDSSIKYAQSGDVSIAYTVFGDGPIDLVFVPGFVSHLEVAFEEPGVRAFLESLAGFARVIVFDKRGTGLSDRGIGAAPLEDYVADTLEVMDAAGSEQAALFGISEGGSIAILFAATYPERTKALAVYGGYARVAADDGYEIGIDKKELADTTEYIHERWGTGVGLSSWAPSLEGDEQALKWWARFQRLSASPRDVKAMLDLYQKIDVSPALGAVSAPTLVLHKKGDRMIPFEMGKYIADSIEGARLVPLSGDDHFFWTENPEEIIAELQEFLTGARSAPEPTRRLATVLFTDVVGSTELAANLGDEKWRRLLGRHDDMTRRALTRFRGTEVKTTGDGFLAVFDGPSSAIRSADAIREGAVGLSCEIRAGIHTGEVEVIGDDIAGMAVHIARRVADSAGAGEIWVSATVPGVVVGSGIEFVDQGKQELSGVPGEWPLFSVSGL